MFSAIACVGPNYELGYNNQLLYSFPEDMAFFKKMTSNDGKRMKAVIMGKKTYESIGRFLPNRMNFVLTHSEFDESKVTKENKPYLFSSYMDKESMEKSLICKTEDGMNYYSYGIAPAVSKAVSMNINSWDIFFIGGCNVYEQGLPYCSRIYLTRVLNEVPESCDTYFPVEILKRDFVYFKEKESGESVTKDGKKIRYSIGEYVRRWKI